MINPERMCNGRIRVDNKEYSKIEFDCAGRPWDYEDEVLKNITFRGYLLGRGKNPFKDAYFKFKAIKP